MITNHTAPATTELEGEEEPEGLAFDLPLILRLARPVQLMGRRRMLALFGGAGALTLVAACGSTSGNASPSSATATTPSTTTPSTTTPTTSSTSNGAAAPSPLAGTEIPDETAGPFPGDGTNGPNALAESGVVRSDIRSSFGSSTTTADGIPVTFQLTIVDAATGATLPGASVYLWHCDRDGDYSLYSDGKTGENYLRGVQSADANGELTFLSVYPGCYPGRWPHAHFEVYDTLDATTNGSQARKTSQLAMPEATSNEAFETTGYEASIGYFAGMSLAADNVFTDGADDQVPTVTGSPADGYTASLVVRV